METPAYPPRYWLVLLALAIPAWADEPPLHTDQQALRLQIASGEQQETFIETFEVGDELFETAFDAVHGVGARVGSGQRFSRVPRADLDAVGEWASHLPARATGPNARARNACHNLPFDDGAGGINANAVRDPLHTGDPARFIQRNTPHLFGIGAIQRLAEEMSADLHGQRERAMARVCAQGGSRRLRLQSKGVDFGTLVLRRSSAEPCQVASDARQLWGIDEDLVVRPLQWKGSRAFVRDFNRDAAHNELGMQGAELVGTGVDGDFDGVVDEFSVGDLTALTIYVAAQPRPTTRLELHRLGLIEPLGGDEIRAIRRGEKHFEDIGCAVCHRPTLTLDDPQFREPSALAAFRDIQFPGGEDPLAAGLDPALPVSFDLGADLPDNRITDAVGGEIIFGNFQVDRHGRVEVRLYGDLRRHDMGPELAEPIDETGVGASVWLTPELWGAGSTAPYLHDGRATTLEEAILAHGGEGGTARDAFDALDASRQAELLAFLENLVLFKLEEE